MDNKFATAYIEICKIDNYDVITTSVLNPNEKLNGGDYGDVIAFDDYSL